MKIELSPGEWAGVLAALRDRIGWQRDQAVEDEQLGHDGLARALRENADDLDRVAKSLREQIAEAGRTLPELEPGEPGTEAVCPTCGEPLAVAVEETDYRRGMMWTRDGSVIVGKSDSVEVTEVRAFCGDSHYWAVPDVEDYA
jgi:hypothetical protein